jgi:Protein of unknown function (DUF3037)
MHGNHLFEYAVIRFVPRVEREEFINVGVILYCKQHNFLQMKFTLNEAKLQAIAAEPDVEELKQHLQAFHHICCGSTEGGPIGKLDIASRFRWLTATRSTIVQTSKVHPGFCQDPKDKLEALHEQLVM